MKKKILVVPDNCFIFAYKKNDVIKQAVISLSDLKVLTQIFVDEKDFKITTSI